MNIRETDPFRPEYVVKFKATALRCLRTQKERGLEALFPSDKKDSKTYLVASNLLDFLISQVFGFEDFLFYIEKDSHPVYTQLSDLNPDEMSVLKDLLRSEGINLDYIAADDSYGISIP